MQNSINYPEPINPANYSGVTINITSPTVNANTGSCCPQPVCYDGNPVQSGYNTYNSNQNANEGKTVYPYQGYQTNVIPQPSYPSQYYMNNYNYPTLPPVQDGYAPKTQLQNEQNENMKVNETIQPNNGIDEEKDVSKEIINNLNQMMDEKHNLEKNGKEKKIVALTNEYIKSLENYLNNPNSEIRFIAAEEILTRFNEDKSRYDDRALNALINKMLQDPEPIIRTAAMSALSSGLASGNELTVKLLKEIQENPDADKADVVDAANILLQKTTVTETKYVPQPPMNPIVADNANASYVTEQKEDTK